MTRIILARIAMFVALFAAFSVAAVELTDAQRDAISERIRPAGESCLEGDSSCGGAAGPANGGGVARSGEEVYNAACLACHTTGAGGAPMIGDTVAWADRIAKGMDVLYDSGVNGVPGTAMMVKGGCMDCSDEEFNAAVDFIVESSQ
ncbi:MAG: cytochrome c5 family protein [Halioglobus sp.]|nr:cytochrome c5 family protein [Halioglobus sp.]